MKQPAAGTEGVIEYEKFTYPDGQPNIKLKTEIDRKDGVNIACRIRNPSELFDLLMVADIINRQSYVNELAILYLMAGRTDRVLSFDQPFTLKIVADMINTVKAKTVVIVEPHSERTIDLISNSEGRYPNVSNMKMKHGYSIATPDEGAAGRYGCKPYIECSKERNPETGKLSNFKVDKTGYFTAGSPILLCDDLCDGGGTFLGIHEKLKELNPGEIELMVTHAIQEEGIRKVAKIYDKVRITNSYKDWDDEGCWEGEKPENVIVSEFSC